MIICENCNDKKYNDLLEVLAKYQLVNRDGDLDAFLDGYAGPEWRSALTREAAIQHVVNVQRPRPLSLDLCPNCGDDRRGKGSLLAPAADGGGQAFCSEACYKEWQTAVSEEVNDAN